MNTTDSLMVGVFIILVAISLGILGVSMRLKDINQTLQSKAAVVQCVQQKEAK